MTEPSSHNTFFSVNKAKALVQFIMALLLFAGIFMPIQKAEAQVVPRYYEYPNTHLDWYTLESEHFLIHFQKGNSRSAKVVSRIAEEVYNHITGLYNLEPENKVSIVLKDREDYSNGAAYFFDDMIDIWVPPLSTQLRGTHNWYRNVISHEFTHIVQLQAAMKRSRRIPAIYLQWLSYEDVRRPDVLYGFPKGIITYPFAGISVPAWFAEGTAQYQRTGLYYDTWDSHRDMILRMRMLSGSWLNFDEMGHFSSKSSIERETVYNQGYAFTIYLANRFGEEVLADITRTLGESGVFDMDKAMKKATGISGHQLFDDWVEERTEFYEKATAHINPTPYKRVEDGGFFNFHPQYSPDGKTLAYLSNRKEMDSGVYLYLTQTDSTNQQENKTSAINSEKSHRVDLGIQPTMPEHTYETGPILRRISTSFDFSPDGKQLVYARINTNKYGEEYRDLHLLNLKKKEPTKRLTNSARLRDPAWSPDGNQIATVQMDDNTLNLALYDLEEDTVKNLTKFGHGEQVYPPAWQPGSDYIYFSYATVKQRAIYRYSLETGRMEAVLEDEFIDYRNPWIDEQGEYLYYSADENGIFNIYRVPVGAEKPDPTEAQQLTSVTGGAFMPSVGKDGTLIYSEFVANGYKISSAPLDSLLPIHDHGAYNPPFPDDARNVTVSEDIQVLNEFSDDDLDPIEDKYFTIADTGKVNLNFPTKSNSDERSFYAYEETITDFTFFPVIRFDNYSLPKGNNGKLLTAGRIGDLGHNLARDFKTGFYFSSREVTSKLTIFGGAMFGLGSQETEGLNDFFQPSRLVSLDRDMFLTLEHRGLPFIDRYWSPTVSVELYNMRRNVNNGLSIEEFPCTSCLPDTSYTDVAYDIWEANLFLRSKLNRFSLAELGIAYSPYRVSTDKFYSEELKQLIQGSTSEYFKSTRFTAAYIFDMNQFYRHYDIAPIGIDGSIRYTYEPSKLLDTYEIKEGSLNPLYDDLQNHSIEFKAQAGFPLTDKTTGSVRTRVFSYFNNPDDYFFLDYAGGFSGMRSYPYFSIGGNTTAFGVFSWYLPLVTNMNTQIERFTMDKAYLRFFGEVGNGWRGPLDINKSLKTGVGMELRWAMNAYYLFPLKWFVSASYGFNQFDVTLPEDFITTNSSNQVTYGREVLFHFGFSFDFEILQNRNGRR